MQEVTKDRCGETGKVCFSYKIASGMVKRFRHAKGHGKMPIRCYHCKFCECWHLTSQKKTGSKNYYDGAEYGN